MYTPLPPSTDALRATAPAHRPAAHAAPERAYGRFEGGPDHAPAWLPIRACEYCFSWAPDPAPEAT